MPAVQLGSRIPGTWAENVTKTVFSLVSSLPFSFIFSLCRVASVFSAEGTWMPALYLKSQLLERDCVSFPHATLGSGIRSSWFSLCAHSCDHGREPKLGQDFLLGSGGETVSLKKECSRETVSVLSALNVKTVYLLCSGLLVFYVLWDSVITLHSLLTVNVLVELLNSILHE